MKIILDDSEIVTLLENIFQYVDQSCSDWGYQWTYPNEAFYIKPELQNKYREEKMSYLVMNGFCIMFLDVEGGEHEWHRLHIDAIKQNLDKCKPQDLINLISQDGDYDFYTTDNTLQTLLFGQIIYG